MKALIISDIHSNIDALNAIWLKESDSDVIYCAGDLVDYGPFPKQVINWIRQHDAICVQGNHDVEVARCYRDRQTLETISCNQMAWKHYNASLLDENDIVFLEQLPKALVFQLDNVYYGLTHVYKEYKVINNLYDFHTFCNSLFPDKHNHTIDRLIFGHTHRRGAYYLSNTNMWLNPGSTSYRRRDDPDQAAHYITITDGIISLNQVVYDLEPLCQHIQNLQIREDERVGMLWAFGSRELVHPETVQTFK